MFMLLFLEVSRSHTVHLSLQSPKRSANQLSTSIFLCLSCSPWVLVQLRSKRVRAQLSVPSRRIIERKSHKWKELRRRRLLAAAPGWAVRGATKAVTRLVEQCLEGNAWQADHVVPVFKGGGLCDIDNMRTLCTVCHQVCHLLL